MILSGSRLHPAPDDLAGRPSAFNGLGFMVLKDPVYTENEYGTQSGLPENGAEYPRGK